MNKNMKIDMAIGYYTQSSLCTWNKAQMERDAYLLRAL